MAAPMATVVAGPRGFIPAIKSWEVAVDFVVANIGAESWPCDVKVVLISNTIGFEASPTVIEVPAIASMQTVEVHLEFLAPNIMGEAMAVWALQSASLPDFGCPLAVTLDVQGNDMNCPSARAVLPDSVLADALHKLDGPLGRPMLPDSAVANALAWLGADPATVLTVAERESLDRKGFCCLGQLLSVEQISEFNQRLQMQLKKEGDGALENESGASRLFDVSNKFELNHDGLMDIPLTHPRVLAAMRHVLGDKIALSSLNYRQANPGGGFQALHTDWGDNEGARAIPPEFQVCNSIWLLDDFTEANGRTRMLPGTHLTGVHPRQVLEDLCSERIGEVYCTGPAGTVFVFNSHLWHGGTLNQTDKPRRALHGYFTRRDNFQQLAQQEHIQPWNYKRMAVTALGRATIAILDVKEPAGDEE